MEIVTTVGSGFERRQSRLRFGTYSVSTVVVGPADRYSGSVSRVTHAATVATADASRRSSVARTFVIVYI